MTPGQRFGARLKQLRREKAANEERDVDQGEVAETVKETQSNYARWEGGRIPKELETVKSLAAFYGVNWLWLLHGEGPKLLDEPTATLDVVAGPKPRSRAAASPTKRQTSGR